MAVDPTTLGAHIQSQVQTGQAPASAAAPATTPPQGAADPVKPDEMSGAKTPEEIEAYWRNRVSQKDRAHAAAEKALREELEQLQARASTAAPATGGQPGTESAADAELRRKYEETTKALETERAARAIDQRKAKYPALVQSGVADAIFATADEASLAKLNELASDEPRGTMIAPTGPRRGQPVADKPLHEMTKVELENKLREAAKGMTGI